MVQKVGAAPEPFAAVPDHNRAMPEPSTAIHEPNKAAPETSIAVPDTQVYLHPIYRSVFFSSAFHLVLLPNL